MRTEQIEYLAQIDQCGSLHKAAENMHISVQALSVSIKVLENELNMKLTVKNKSGTYLTENGKKVLKAGNCFLRNLEKIKRENATYKYLTGNRELEVFLTTGVGETEFPKIFSAIYEEFPSFKLKGSVIKIDDLLNGNCKADKTICLLYQITVDGMDLLDMRKTPYFFQPLMQKKYYCLAHSKFALAQQKSIALKDILKNDIIIYTPTRKLFDALLSYVGSTQKILYVENYAIYKQMLRDGHGLGLTVLEDKEESFAFNNLCAVPFRENIYSTLGYVHNKNVDLSDEAMDFCCYLKRMYSV